MTIRASAVGVIDPDLSQQWEELWGRSAPRHLFCQPAWVRPWYRTLGRGYEPYILTAHKAESLIGAAPLALERSRAWGGVVHAAGLEVSDYTDWLAPAGPERPDVLAAMVECLEREVEWQGLDLPGISSLEDALTIRSVLESRGLAARLFAGLECPFLAMPEGFEPVWQGLTSRARYNVRSRERRLGSLGRLAFIHAEPGQVPGYIEHAISLHARRWHGQRTSTVFSSSAQGRAFYRSAIPNLAERGVADLAALELNGEPIAMAIGFRHAGVYHYYLPAWEPRYAAYAPSTLLLVNRMRAAASSGCVEIDFMLGDEDYKRAWATGARRVWTLVAARRTPRGQAWLRWRAAQITLRARARDVPLLRSIRRHGLLGWNQPA
jgi:CelD/BcsL family acetyltransferase involved in cellulose biosynthesis